MKARDLMLAIIGGLLLGATLAVVVLALVPELKEPYPLALAQAPTPAPTPLTITDCTKPLATVPAFSLTPAPASETPLQRWQRTKADYDRACAIEQRAEDEIEHALTYVAIEPYMDAQRALQVAKCGTVCTADKPGAETIELREAPMCKIGECLRSTGDCGKCGK